MATGEWWNLAHQGAPTVQLHVVEELLEMFSVDEPVPAMVAQEPESEDECLMSLSNVAVSLSQEQPSLVEKRLSVRTFSLGYVGVWYQREH